MARISVSAPSRSRRPLGLFCLLRVVAPAAALLVSLAGLGCSPSAPAATRASDGAAPSQNASGAPAHDPTVRSGPTCDEKNRSEVGGLYRSIVGGDEAAMQEGLRRGEEKQVRADLGVRARLPLSGWLRARFPRMLDQVVLRTPEAGGSEWRAAIGFHDRYVLSVLVPVTLDARCETLLAHGAAEIGWQEILEVQRMSAADDDRISVSTNGRLPIDERVLIASEGDMEVVLGARLVRDAPVPLFGEAMPFQAGLGPR